MESENKLQRLIIHPDLIPAQNRLKRQIHQRRILIDGELEDWNGPVHQVFSPVYLKKTNNSSAEEAQLLIGSYPLAISKEAELALNAAVKAYNGGRGQWPSMPVQKRIRRLDVFTKKMVQRKDEIVNLIMWEIGKSSADAEKEFDRTIEYIQDTVRAAKKLNNSTSAFQVQQNLIGQTKRLPYGVVLCMGPFNYPLNETFTTLIPALIMGNTILFKPPKHGTLLFEPLLEAFWDAFPKGVVNTVYGRGRDTVPFLMQSGKVDVLALIGSSKVADSLKKMDPKSNRLKSVLGLDAKNAAIVMDNAELDLTVKECISGAFSFNGQRCTALKILFVHTDIVDRFNKRLVEEAEKLAIGMPWTAGVAITPLAEPEKPKYLQECLEDAAQHGATILNAASGGGSVYKSLMKPAIVYPVNEAMKLYREEQFGPIIPIVPFDDVQIPVDYITESSFGQQVSIFSRDSEEIGLLIDLLAGQVGRININSQCQRSPDTFSFNGRKDSAEGTLSVEEALLAFSVDSVVSTKQTAFNQSIIDDILVNHKSNRLSHTIAL